MAFVYFSPLFIDSRWKVEHLCHSSHEKSNTFLLVNSKTHSLVCRVCSTCSRFNGSKILLCCNHVCCDFYRCDGTIEVSRSRWGKLVIFEILSHVSEILSHVNHQRLETFRDALSPAKSEIRLWSRYHLRNDFMRESGETETSDRMDSLSDMNPAAKFVGGNLRRFALNETKKPL